MKKEIHRAESRGGGEHGWLSTRHSFSFADWYEPTRMGFGALRVLNDDRIAPGSGFPMHPHRDMEIITVVMKGALVHEDSMGNRGVVRAGEVQVMSAGSGVVHSEANASDTEPLELFQIWINTNGRGHTPRYDQHAYAPVRNELQSLVTSNESGGFLYIHQDAHLCRGEFDAGLKREHRIKHYHGVYFFVIEGKVRVEGEELGPRDAIGISHADSFIYETLEPSVFLLIEVPIS